MIKIIRTLFYLFIFVGLAAALYVGYEYNKTMQYRNPETVLVKIKRGSSVRKIAYELASHHVVDHDIKFEIYLRIKDLAKGLQAGEYEFEEGLNIDEVIDKMRRGDVKLYKFTIPEGQNIKDVCRILVEKELMLLTECDELIHDTAHLQKSLQDDSLQGLTSLEGFLFPETYAYDSDVTPRRIFEQMISMFVDKLGTERIQKANAMGLSLRQLITFASIVEKETGLASERPEIASVFHTRLKLGMLLQTDPTVIYGIPNYDGNIRKSDLLTDTPYNTYTRPGLPVGPICNPGLASIDAVLNPNPSEYLYFVAKGDGGHYFSKTLDEHNEAVRRYQLKQGTP